MKTGKLKLIIKSDTDDQVIKNLKFLEFDRIMQEQSGSHRITMLQKSKL